MLLFTLFFLLLCEAWFFSVSSLSSFCFADVYFFLLCSLFLDTGFCILVCALFSWFFCYFFLLTRCFSYILVYLRCLWLFIYILITYQNVLLVHLPICFQAATVFHLSVFFFSTCFNCANVMQITEVKVADIPDVDLSRLGVTKYGNFSVEVVDPVSDYLELLEVRNKRYASSEYWDEHSYAFT